MKKQREIDRQYRYLAAAMAIMRDMRGFSDDEPQENYAWTVQMQDPQIQAQLQRMACIIRRKVEGDHEHAG